MRYVDKNKNRDNFRSGIFVEKTKKIVSSLVLAGVIFSVGMVGQSKAAASDVEEYTKMVEEYKDYGKNLVEAQIKSKLKHEGAINLYSEKEISDSAQMQTDEVMDVFFNQKESKAAEQFKVHMKILPGEEGDNKTRVQLVINDVTDLDKKELKSLEKNYIVDSIKMKADHIEMKDDIGDIYSAQEYKDVLKMMKENFDSIKNNKKLSELEKAVLVMNKIKDIEYDYEQYNNDMTNLDLDDKEVRESRNLKNATQGEMMVCEGYAQLYKNAAKYVGLEAKVIKGNVKYAMNQGVMDGGISHVWNQVKIDGNYYNVDITTLQENFENGNYSAIKQQFTSDKEFNLERTDRGEELYVPILGLAEQCDESIDFEDIETILEKEEQGKYGNKISEIFKSVQKKVKNIAHKVIGKEEIKALPEPVEKMQRDGKLEARQEFIDSFKVDVKEYQYSNEKIKEDFNVKDIEEEIR